MFHSHILPVSSLLQLEITEAVCAQSRLPASPKTPSQSDLVGMQRQAPLIVVKVQAFA